MANQQQVPIPEWEVQQLNALGQQNKLSGIPPYVLAGIAENESSGEQAGAGINSSGYGGYFGANQTEIPSSVLQTSSKQSFDQQAQATASMLAGYQSPAGPIGDAAVWNLGPGGSNNGAGWQNSADAQDAVALAPGDDLVGTAPVGASQGGSSSGGGSTSGGSSTSIIGQLTPKLPSAPGGLLDPLNWGISGANAILKGIMPILLILLGIILVLGGLFLTFKSGTTVNLQSLGLGQQKPAPQQTPAPEPKPKAAKSAKRAGEADAAEDVALVAA